MAQTAATLRESADKMRNMTDVAGETSANAAAMSEGTLAEVESIAAVSDQLSSSIQEIATLIERSFVVVAEATNRAGWHGASCQRTIKSTHSSVRAAPNSPMPPTVTQKPMPSAFAQKILPG